MQKAVFDGAYVRKDIFDKADLTKANFSNSTIEMTSFDLATMTGANFSGAKLVDVTFLNTNLQNAKFDADTKMENVDFSGADLSRAKIEKFTAKKVIYDAKTSFPDGFEPRQYGFTRVGEKAASVSVEKKRDSVADDAMPKKKKRRKKVESDEE
jgi:hypothetical protein